MPIRIHTEEWQTLCNSKKKKKKTHHFLEQDSHPNFLDRLNLDEFRLGIVLPAFFVLPDLPREPHLLWQQPKVATNL